VSHWVSTNSFYFILFYFFYLFFIFESSLQFRETSATSNPSDETRPNVSAAARPPNYLVTHHVGVVGRQEKKGFAALEDDDGNGDRGPGGSAKKRCHRTIFKSFAPFVIDNGNGGADTQPLSVTLSLSPSLHPSLSFYLSLSLNESARAFFPTFFHRFFLTFAPLPRRFSPR
jgi:hypothetical protein